MFVGKTGVERILQRTARLAKGGDVLNQGGIPFEMVQRAVNFWYSVSLDLFGGEDSSNAATFFGAGLKGRDREMEQAEHSGLNETFKLEKFAPDGTMTVEELPLRRAMNEVLREAYVKDCDKVVKSWNRALEAEGTDFRLTLPHKRFHRAQGVYAGLHFDPQGRFVTPDEWEKRKDDWIVNDRDRDVLANLMTEAVVKPGEFAGWIAPPPRGIDGQPLDFEYVKFHSGSPYAE